MKHFGFLSKKTHKAQLHLAADAFSDGQIGSKLWLCGEVENSLLSIAELREKPLVIWVLAGWHGLLPFLLFSRERLHIAQVVLFDIDPAAVATSLRVNDRWRISGQFAARVHDVNSRFSEAGFVSPDVVINTSCEHFSVQDWWYHVADGALVAVQSTDMPHIEHVSGTSSAAELQKRFSPWKEIRFEGELRFDYGQFAFSRHLVIGSKGAGSSS